MVTALATCKTPISPRSIRYRGNLSSDLQDAYITKIIRYCGNRSGDLQDAYITQIIRYCGTRSGDLQDAYITQSNQVLW